MKKIISSFLMTFLLSGCFLYDCGYTRNDDLRRYGLGPDDKVPLTYSLDFVSSFPSDAFGAPSEKSIKRKIEEALKGCGLFTSVVYDRESSGGYHISFTYRDGGYDPDEIDARAYVYTCTLFSIPIPENYGADLQAVVYLEGKPIWSVAHTEKCRMVVCWYGLPAGLVFNYWSVWSSIEWNLVNATVNDMTEVHKKRYLQNADVKLMSAGAQVD